MASESVTVYIKGDRNVEVTKTDVTLGDIVTLECADKVMLPRIKALKILKIHGEKEQRFVISILKIIACIHEQYPKVEVQNLGESDLIVTYENQKTPPYAWHILKVTAVAAVIFVGSAFSIMAFNNDVGGTELFGQIYELVMGSKSDGFTVLEITYSIGLTLGILIFFNHFGKKRFTVDPTPMEVQMRLYENDIQTTLVEDAARRKKEMEVGGK
ncbi:stage V sporulation protein AA [Blautia sp. MSJ-19]|uniref:stage V sporulation protein AA n=1 Tax=Blautia sp. MSJ-19 TaxID=2841517 RepID=UPI001C0EDA08|nr:stage V sporulation protein AA [Blautia sp. MSJ-19]MBU5481196.1 stage V sporulation protein AA [Blautia sp. MSJ-19]